MIYKTNFFVKEMKNAYTSGRASTKSMLSLGLFMGLCSFALYNVLLTLKESVLSESAPYILMKNYFSPLFIYVAVSFVVIALYMLFQYNYLSFAEIRTNKWYNLIYMGFKPIKMIMYKLITIIIKMFLMYTAGFVTTLLFVSFLDFTSADVYLISLYLSGLLTVVLFALVYLSVSLFVKKASVARTAVIVVGILYIVMFSKTGAYAILSNPLSLITPFAYATQGYVICCAILAVFSFVALFCYAKKISVYYSYDFYKGDMDFDDSTVLVEKTKQDEFKLCKINKAVDDKKRKALGVATNVCLVAVIIFTVFLNALILFVSLSDIEKGVSVLGRMPVVFASDVMDPEIKYNDLAMFKKLKSQDSVEIGDVVAFRKEDNISIGIIESITDGVYVADITNYPESIPDGYYSEEVSRDSIEAVMTGTSRYGGLFVLFANTTAGRILLLLIPVTLIFFYNNIMNFFSARIEHGLRD